LTWCQKSMRIGTVNLVNRAESNQKTNWHDEHKAVVWSKWTADLIWRNISILLMFGIKCALYRKSAINFHFA
jgi:hypothetical protein